MKKVQKSFFLLLLIPAAVILIGMTVFYAYREKIYRSALEQFESGDNQKSYELFSFLRNYKDTEHYLEQILKADPLLAFRSAEKGDEVIFGRYEQDDRPDNGPEPIRWFVLDHIEDRLLLLSIAALDGKPYHTESFEPVTWENCTLRDWLNSSFFESAFEVAEQALIPVVLNQNSDQSAVGTEGGADTRDRVFLLSETEASIYFGNDLDQDTVGKAYASEYASRQGVEVDDEGAVSWWLRSPGVYPYSAQFVDQQGKPYLSGAYTDIDYQFAVRPAIWLDLK